ncbi:MAG: DUF1003 domain-containing protein [Nitrospirae bacterium]|nr:DUF1003 domain-containing protein [Nitrospirota bacterium]
MPKSRSATVTCQVCGKQYRLNEVFPAEFIRRPMLEMIRKEFPALAPGGYICIPDLTRFRAEYVQSVIEEDKGELTALEKQVVNSLKEQELLTTNLNIEYDRQLSLGERLADRLADFGGSWQFISIFAAVIFFWMLMNSLTFFLKPFDPYPFIFLNLVLSCLAAIQAPIIMMSQNRQESRDRMQAEHDYRVNLKAELEIRQLHEKIDHLILNQWQRLLEIQEVQMELMEELAQKGKPKA